MKTKLVILLFAILMLVLFSCSDTQAPENFDASYEGKNTEIDMNGLKISMLFNTSTESAFSSDVVLGYNGESIFDEMVHTRISDIEKKLNADLDLCNTDIGISTMITQQSMAGKTDMAMGFTASYDITGAMETGMLVDYATLSDVLDYSDSEKFGIPQYLKPMMWDNGLYGVLPNAWPITNYSSIMGLICCNEQIIKSIGMTDPREYIENDNWDWDTFESLLPYYAHYDNTDRYVYALRSTIHWLFTSLQLTNGVPFTYFDTQTNRYELGMRNLDSVAALDKAYDWTFGDMSQYVQVNTSGWKEIREEFVDQRHVMAIINASYIIQTSHSLAYELEDFSILTMPHGPKGNINNTGTTLMWIECSACIPTLYQDSEAAGLVLNELFEPFEGFETKDKINDFLKSNFFYDDRDVQNLYSGYRNVQYIYRYENLTDVLISIGNKRGMTEMLESYKEADETNREKYLENKEETCKYLFPDFEN